MNITVIEPEIVGGDNISYKKLTAMTDGGKSFDICVNIPMIAEVGAIDNKPGCKLNCRFETDGLWHVSGVAEKKGTIKIPFRVNDALIVLKIKIRE